MAVAAEHSDARAAAAIATEPADRLNEGTDRLVGPGRDASLQQVQLRRAADAADHTGVAARATGTAQALDQETDRPATGGRDAAVAIEGAGRRASGGPVAAAAATTCEVAFSAGATAAIRPDQGANGIRTGHRDRRGEEGEHGAIRARAVAAASAAEIERAIATGPTRTALAQHPHADPGAVDRGVLDPLAPVIRRSTVSSAIRGNEGEAVAAIVAVAAGRISWSAPDLASLSPREQQILHLMGEARSLQDMGAGLRVSVKTIGTYRERLKAKLGFDSVRALERFAIEHALGRAALR